MIQVLVSHLKLQHLDQISWLAQLGTCVAISIGWMPAILAQSIGSTTPDICEVNFNLLKSDAPIDRENITTADTVSARGMTLPSLWWTSEQFPAKLVTNWIANRQEKQVYLLVNDQYWNLLDYIDRYRTIDQFGRDAQGYGYNLNVCSSQKIVLARYSCDPLINGKDQANCQIWLNAAGQNGLGVQNN